MTDKTALRQLIEAAEAGDATGGKVSLAFDTPCQDFQYAVNKENVWMAYRGSLDAAKALHEALLPGWGGAAGFDYYTGFCRSIARVSHLDKYHTVKIDGEFSNPARAWLIAILKAHEAQK